MAGELQLVGGERQDLVGFHDCDGDGGDDDGDCGGDDGDGGDDDGDGGGDDGDGGDNESKSLTCQH